MCEVSVESSKQASAAQENTQEKEWICKTREAHRITYLILRRLILLQFHDLLLVQIAFLKATELFTEFLHLHKVHTIP